MIVFSKKKHTPGFFDFCFKKCMNYLPITKDNNYTNQSGTTRYNIYSSVESHSGSSNIFMEMLNFYAFKVKRKNLNTKLPNEVNTNKYVLSNEIDNSMLYSQSANNEVLLCLGVLKYKDEEVDNELNYIHNYFKKIKCRIDPYTLCENKIKNIDEHIYNIIKTDYNNINEFVTYIYQYKGKKFRVILSILLKNILTYIDNVTPKNKSKFRNIQRNISKTIQNSHQNNRYRHITILNKLYSRKNLKKKIIQINKNPDSNIYTKNMILENQCKIIAASEIIHMGSLLHDDVIDESEKRRGSLSLHKKYGNKVSILSGDFLLARACSVFASIGYPEICKRFSYVIESLIKGEFLQTNLNYTNIEDALKTYLIKSYHKTASLFSHLFACIAIISFQNDQITELCFNLGLHIGMAFQLYDDYLDYKINPKTNQPILNDIKNNIKTAPLLFSYNYNPNTVLSLINKKYLSNDDIQNVLFYIKESNSMKKNELCSLLHMKKAADILESLISYCKISNNIELQNYQKNEIDQNRTALTSLIFNMLTRTTK
ncbi:octaprenyl pyrophosphate synthase, putative [Plasmodium berghei]|uniref:Octaprenyl pyrophosphate synthase, putative n=2 Tax=Plasmodium berghei TaxID=5821 RepID=A0A509AEM9_PLABA|nr:octaprenyl pyrophosphate synthase, putative [Plasmodium berghei ANKA]CXH91717.1 octaprenyl pyrophosphate synthase, putative [Plasmodium berghei]SCL90579.1 octaprenyl pyrophosphate synthase, putative [Plasmodium berghei]SCM15309.1 octaprenyl pyrophosphate synthase, putative [Plasmodium berghei]SCM17101.1 octaprenyl pyrophosphate synthase, putative [Plasmodium berghei]SCN22069.1 octaprenyl pyrophosphate synthase, putative [Plasmodium berghei]|eukprot:XP_034419892.1 octaprenyl pyrophosphate synthase, putative [Plasmodium berghei ANKA]